MEDEEFYQGVIAALAVIELHGNDVIFDDIVHTVNPNLLVAVARKSGDMRWSGVARWARRSGYYEKSKKAK